MQSAPPQTRALTGTGGDGALITDFRRALLQRRCDVRLRLWTVPCLSVQRPCQIRVLLQSCVRKAVVRAVDCAAEWAVVWTSV